MPKKDTRPKCEDQARSDESSPSRAADHEEDKGAWEFSSSSPEAETHVKEAHSSSEEPSQQPKRFKGDEGQSKGDEGKSSSEPLVLIPQHLKDRPLHVYTVGCRGELWMDEILEKAELDKDKCLTLDCRGFMGARCNVQWHYGTITRVITNIMDKDKEQLKEVFKKICSALQENEKLDTLIFYCDHGKHRSVGAADVVSNAMSRVSGAWDILPMVHLMKQYWSRKKCGWCPCEECDKHNEEKEDAYQEAADMFYEEWINGSR